MKIAIIEKRGSGAFGPKRFDSTGMNPGDTITTKVDFYRLAVNIGGERRGKWYDEVHEYHVVTWIVKKNGEFWPISSEYYGSLHDTRRVREWIEKSLPVVTVHFRASTWVREARRLAGMPTNR